MSTRGREPSPADAVARPAPGQDPVSPDRPHPLVVLQRAVGNAAVLRLLDGGGGRLPGDGGGMTTPPAAGAIQRVLSSAQKRRRRARRTAVKNGDTWYKIDDTHWFVPSGDGLFETSVALNGGRKPYLKLPGAVKSWTNDFEDAAYDAVTSYDAVIGVHVNRGAGTHSGAKIKKTSDDSEIDFPGDGAGLGGNQAPSAELAAIMDAKGAGWKSNGTVWT